VPEPGAVDVLVEVAGAVGTLAVISGRPIEGLLGMAGFGRVPGIHLLGHYGLERWHDGTTVSPEPTAGIKTARLQLPALLADAADGVTVEDKVHSLVVHTRNTAAPADELARLSPGLLSLAETLELEAVPGRYVVELRPFGVDKGDALRGLIDGVGARTVIYIGDDLGDLPAYDVIEELTRAGAIAGMTVASVAPGDADAPPEPAERADLVLAGPTAVVAWLAGTVALLS
jgi:trehalose 6-phosphate phosphatase